MLGTCGAMAETFTVYQVIKSYCDYEDQWEGVRGEYDTREEAQVHFRFKQENPDSNAMYSIKVVERDFPACRICEGTGRVANDQWSSKPCACNEKRRAPGGPG